MLMLIARPPRPDAVHWPGRRALAAIDAVAWPLLFAAAAWSAPFSTGVIGQLAIPLAIAFALPRFCRAVWRNERYWFTTWSFAMPIAFLVFVGLVMKIA
ncbi:MAG: hypothetical protein EOO27_11545 [Comamonadaceae bacterium]|nr:MAG: hypothetical protein EOO27_11545 [Comamonadaceae bacterium]